MISCCEFDYFNNSMFKFDVQLICAQIRYFPMLYSQLITVKQFLKENKNTNADYFAWHSNFLANQVNIHLVF
jgi:hypothetical protein